MNYKSDVSIKSPTEIFVPKLQYPNGFEVLGNDVEIFKENDQLVILKLKPESSSSIKVLINRKKN